jgi:hypothetical protein
MDHATWPRHRPLRKHRFQEFLYCCVFIRCPGHVFIAPWLPFRFNIPVFGRHVTTYYHLERWDLSLLLGSFSLLRISPSWRWRQYVPSKSLWTSIGLYHVTSQEIALFLRFNVVTEVKVRIVVFWIMMPCSLVGGYQRLREVLIKTFGATKYGNSVVLRFTSTRLHGIITQITTIRCLHNLLMKMFVHALASLSSRTTRDRCNTRSMDSYPQFLVQGQTLRRTDLQFKETCRMPTWIQHNHLEGLSLLACSVLKHQAIFF